MTKPIRISPAIFTERLLRLTPSGPSVSWAMLEPKTASYLDSSFGAFAHINIQNFFLNARKRSI